jgi:hypothetical protein
MGCRWNAFRGHRVHSKRRTVMNRGLTLIILGILVVIGAAVVMTSWDTTVSDPSNTPARVDEVPAPPKQP